MLKIENISGTLLEINDLGLSLEDGATLNLTQQNNAVDLANSGSPGGDLYYFVTNFLIEVKDPRDGTTPLSIVDGVLAISSCNDANYGLPPNSLMADALDVDLSGAGGYLTYSNGLITRTTIGDIGEALSGNGLGNTLGVIENHGSLTGLGDDDHPQYLQKAGGTTTGTVIFDNNTPDSISFKSGSGDVSFESGAGDLILNGSSIEFIGATSRMRLANGTAIAPSLTFHNDTNTGLYSNSSDSIGIVSGGTESALFTTTTSTINNDVVLPAYPDTRDDGVASKSLYVDSSGNVKLGSVKNIHRIDITGRAYLYRDTRWVTSSHNEHGANFFQWSQSAGTGSTPVVEYDAIGHYVKAGDTIHDLTVVFRLETAIDLTDVIFMLVYRHPQTVSEWVNGVNTDGQITSSSIYSENLFVHSNSSSHPAFPVVAGTVYRRNEAIDFTVPYDGHISVYIKPVSTSLSTQYLYVQYVIETNLAAQEN